MSRKNKDHPDSLAPYREALAEHGPGFRATLWSSSDAQRRRFEVMTEMTDLTGAGILDAGCGSGDFAAALLHQEVDFERFIGIDGLAAQIEAARRRNLARSEFHTGDFIHDPDLFARYSPDYVCFSGSLNNVDGPTVESIIRGAYRAAHRGVLFNFLSDRARPEQLVIDAAPARRFDTLGMIDLALTLSPRVQFRQDYLDGHDATVLIEKANGGPLPA